MLTLLRLLASATIGFISSRVLYKALHRDEVPEMFRYGFGVVLVALAATLFSPDEDTRQWTLMSVILAAVGVGAGVATNRMLMD